ncbi:Hypothetical protein GbCGDNIH9_0919 [Granulibacter bethesdensis]|uniref:Peptidase C51 domain-containing protein n=1 Tax=Granulibacter bethesdensis TaxID=364410 RepID=A0AAC9K775_9PROT|nr:Hypothetical protein GbCGDNIH9_0919 [Granulibacter bethesdensis]APH61757.1 Hypothetical protein GbCGDNIH8_0919 [Granulibacter bethesdensis]
MLAWATGKKVLGYGTAIALSLPLMTGTAEARSKHVAGRQAGVSHNHHASLHIKHSLQYASRHRTFSALQCVPYARSVSGIELKGNAANWWDAAEGVYARGNTPEPGSILNFRANGHMRLGHVAVVEQVINSREVLIDHANWRGPGARGGVSKGISVVDVSPNNDWTSVRVALGHSDTYGSVYPTYGFIYDRPEGQPGSVTRMASASIPDMNPPPRNLSPARGRVAAVVGGSDQPVYQEVAQAPSSSRKRGIDLSVGRQITADQVAGSMNFGADLATDSINHNLR